MEKPRVVCLISCADYLPFEGSREGGSSKDLSILSRGAERKGRGKAFAGSASGSALRFFLVLPRFPEGDKDGLNRQVAKTPRTLRVPIGVAHSYVQCSVTHCLMSGPSRVQRSKWVLSTTQPSTNPQSSIVNPQSPCRAWAVQPLSHTSDAGLPHREPG